MAYTYLQLQGRVIDIPHRPKNQDIAEIQALVNESYAYCVVSLNALIKTVTKPLTANDGDYTIATDFAIPDYANVRTLYYTAASGLSNFQPLVPVSIAELQAARKNNSSATSPALIYCMNGWGSLSIQPLPSTGDTLTITYGAYPIPLASNGDTPVALPTHLHHLIVAHASAVCMEQVDMNYAQRMMEQFEEREMRRARRWMNDHVSSQPYGPGAYRDNGISRYPGDYFSPV